MRLSVVLILLLTTHLAFSQGHAHILEVGMRGGMSQVLYLPADGDSHPSLHTAFDLNYIYHSPYVIGLRTGLSFGRAGGTFGKTHYQDSYSTTDVEGATMLVGYDISRFRESHTVLAASVPLQLALSWRHLNCYIGPRFSFPLQCTWHESVRNAALWVDYPDFDNRVEESVPLAASRNFDISRSGTLSLPRWNCSASLELSYDLQISANHRRLAHFLSIGVYMDYLLTSVDMPAATAESLLMLTDTRDGFPLQRLLSPAYQSLYRGNPLIDNVHYFDVGVKLSWRLSAQHRKRYACKCIDM